MADKSRSLDFYIRLIHETGQAVPGLKAELSQITKAATAAGKEQQAVFEEMFANVGSQKGLAGSKKLIESMFALRGALKELKSDAVDAMPKLFTPAFLAKTKSSSETVIDMLDGMGKRAGKAFVEPMQKALGSLATGAYKALGDADKINMKNLGTIQSQMRTLFNLAESFGVSQTDIFKNAGTGVSEIVKAVTKMSLGDLELLRRKGLTVSRDISNEFERNMLRKKADKRGIAAFEFFNLGDLRRLTTQFEDAVMGGNKTIANDLWKQIGGVLDRYKKARLLTERDIAEVNAKYSYDAIAERARRQAAELVANAPGAARTAAVQAAPAKGEIKALRKEIEDTTVALRNLMSQGKGKQQANAAEITKRSFALVALEEKLATLEGRQADPNFSIAKTREALKQRGLLVEAAVSENKQLDQMALRYLDIETASTRVLGAFEKLAAVRAKMTEKQLAAKKKPDQLLLAESDVQRSITALQQYGVTADAVIRQARADYPALAGMFGPDGRFSLASIIETKGKEAAKAGKKAARDTTSGFNEVWLEADSGFSNLTDRMKSVQGEMAKIFQSGSLSKALQKERAALEVRLKEQNATLARMPRLEIGPTKSAETGEQLMVVRKQYQDLEQEIIQGRKRLSDLNRKGLPQASLVRLDELQAEQGLLDKILTGTREVISRQDTQLNNIVKASRDRRLREMEAYYEAEKQLLQTKVKEGEISPAQLPKKEKILEAAKQRAMFAIAQERLLESTSGFNDVERAAFSKVLDEQENTRKARLRLFKGLEGGATFLRQVSENIYETAARVEAENALFAKQREWVQGEGLSRRDVFRRLAEKTKAPVEKGMTALEENGKALIDVAQKRAVEMERATREVLLSGETDTAKLTAKLKEAGRAGIGRTDIANLIPDTIDTPLKNAMFEAFAAGFKIHRGDLGRVLEAGIAKSPELTKDTIETARSVADTVGSTFSKEFARRGLLVPETLATALRNSMRRLSLSSAGGKIQQSELKLFEPLMKQALSFNPELTAKEADAAATKMVGITASAIRKAEGKLSKVSPDFLKGLIGRLGLRESIQGVKEAFSVPGATVADTLGDLYGKLFDVKAADQTVAKAKANVATLGNKYSAMLASSLFDIVKNGEKVTRKAQPQIFDLFAKTFSTDNASGFGELLPERNQFSDLIGRVIKSLEKMSPALAGKLGPLQTQLENAATLMYKTRGEFQKQAVFNAKVTGDILRAERDALAKNLGREATNEAMVKAAGKDGAALIARIFKARQQNAEAALREEGAKKTRGGLSQEMYDTFAKRLNESLTWDPKTKLGVSQRGNISDKAAEAVKQVLRDLSLVKPVNEWSQADLDKLVSSALGLGKFKDTQKKRAKALVDGMFAPILADIAEGNAEMKAKVQDTMARQPQKGPQVIPHLDAPELFLRQIAERQADAVKMGKREKERFVNAVLEQNKQYDEIAKAQGQRKADEEFLASAQAQEQKREAVRAAMRAAAEQSAKDMENLQAVADRMRKAMTPAQIKAEAKKLRESNEALALYADDVRSGKERGRGRRKLDIDSKGPSYTPEQLGLLKADQQLRNEEAAAIRERRRQNRERVKLVKAILAEELRMDEQLAYAQEAKIQKQNAADAGLAKQRAAIHLKRIKQQAKIREERLAAEALQQEAAKAAPAVKAAAPPIPPVILPPATLAAAADDSAKGVKDAGKKVADAVVQATGVVDAASKPKGGKKPVIPTVAPPPADVDKEAEASKRAIDTAAKDLTTTSAAAAEKVTKGKGRGKKAPTVLPVTPETVAAEVPPVIKAIEDGGDKIAKTVNVLTAGFGVRASGRKSKIFPNIEGEAKAVYDELSKTAKVFREGQKAIDAGRIIADPAAYQRAAEMIGRVTEGLGKAGINMRVLKDGTLGFYNAISLGGAKIQNLATAMNIAKETKEPKAITTIAASAKDASALVGVLTQRLEKLQEAQKKAAPAAETKKTVRSEAEQRAQEQERLDRKLAENRERQVQVEEGRKKAAIKAVHKAASDAEDALQKQVIENLAARVNKATSRAETVKEKVITDPRVGIGEKVQAQLANLDQRFNQMSYRFQHMGWQLGLVGGVMVAGFMKTMQAAAALNKELTKTAAIMEANDNKAKPFADYYNEAKKAALEWSTTTIFAATEVNQAMLALAQTGQSGKESMLLPKMLEFAAAGELKLGDAVRSAVSAMTAFRMSAEEIGTVTNAMTVAAISTNAEVQDMADAFKHIAPIASMAGMSIEATAAAVGRLSQAGIRGSMAGTGLKRAISELMAPTGKASKYLHALNIQATDLATGTLKSMPDIVDQFRAAFDRLGPSADKAGILMEIFGMRAGPAMVALVNESGDKLRQLEKSIIDSSGKMAEIAGRQYESLNGYLTRLGNSISNLRAIAGEQTDWSIFKTAVEVLTNLIGTITRLVDESRSFKIVVGGLLLIGGAIGVLATAGGVISMLISGLGTLATVVAMFMKGNNLVGFKETWAELKLLWQADKTLLKQNTDSVAMLGFSIKELNYYMATATVSTLKMQQAELDAAIAAEKLKLATDKENKSIIDNIALLEARAVALKQNIVSASERAAAPPPVPPIIVAPQVEKTKGIFSKLFDSIKKSFAGLAALPLLLFGGGKGAKAGTAIASAGTAAAKATIGFKGFAGVIGKLIGTLAGPAMWIFNLWMLYDVIKMLGREFTKFLGGGAVDELPKKLEDFKKLFSADRKPLGIQELIGLKSDPEAFNKYQNELEQYHEAWLQTRDALDEDIKNRQKTLHFVPTEMRDLLRIAELNVQMAARGLGDIARLEENAATQLGDRAGALEKIRDMLGTGEDKSLSIKGLLGDRTKDLDDILAGYEEIKSHEEEMASAAKASSIVAVESLTDQRNAIDDLYDSYSTMVQYMTRTGDSDVGVFKEKNKNRLVNLMGEIDRVTALSKMPYTADLGYQAAAVARLEQYGKERIGIVKFFMQGELNEIKTLSARAKDAEFENMVDVKKLKALIYGESIDQLRKYYKEAARVERDYEKQTAKLREDVAKAQIDAQDKLRESSMPDTDFLSSEFDFNVLATKMAQMAVQSDKFNQSLALRNELLREGKTEAAAGYQAQADAALDAMTGIKKQLASEIALRAMRDGDKTVLNRLVSETRIGKEMDKQAKIADRLKGLSASQKDWEKLKIIKEAEKAEQRRADAAADIPKQQLAALTQLRDMNKAFMTDLTKAMGEIRDLLRSLSVLPGVSMFKAPLDDARAFNEELTELLGQLSELADKGDLGGEGREQVQQKISALLAKREAETNPLLPSKAGTESAFKAVDTAIETSKGKAVAAVNEVGQAEKKWIETNADLKDQRTEQSKQKALGQQTGAPAEAKPAVAQAAKQVAEETGSAAGRSYDRFLKLYKEDTRRNFAELGNIIDGFNSKFWPELARVTRFEELVENTKGGYRLIGLELNRSLSSYFDKAAADLEKALKISPYGTNLQPKVRDENITIPVKVETILQPKPRDTEVAKQVGKEYGKGIKTAMGDALSNLDEVGNRLKGTFTMKDGQMAFVPFAEGMQDAAAKSATQISDTLKTALSGLSGKGFITGLGSTEPGQGMQPLFSPLVESTAQAAKSLDKVPEPADATASALKGIVPAANAATDALSRVGSKGGGKPRTTPPDTNDEGEGFATGGHLPGYGGGDIVPALLEPGEFILRKEAVKKYGAHRIDAMNKSAVPRFKEGGLVAPPSGLKDKLKNAWEEVGTFASWLNVNSLDELEGRLQEVQSRGGVGEIAMRTVLGGTSAGASQILNFLEKVAPGSTLGAAGLTSGAAAKYAPKAGEGFGQMFTSMLPALAVGAPAGALTKMGLNAALRGAGGVALRAGAQEGLVAAASQVAAKTVPFISEYATWLAGNPNDPVAALMGPAVKAAQVPGKMLGEMLGVSGGVSDALVSLGMGAAIDGSAEGIAQNAIMEALTRVKAPARAAEVVANDGRAGQQLLQTMTEQFSKAAYQPPSGDPSAGAVKDVSLFTGKTMNKEWNGAIALMNDTGIVPELTASMTKERPFSLIADRMTYFEQQGGQLDVDALTKFVGRQIGSGEAPASIPLGSIFQSSAIDTLLPDFKAVRVTVDPSRPFGGAAINPAQDAIVIGTKGLEGMGDLKSSGIANRIRDSFGTAMVHEMQHAVQNRTPGMAQGFDASTANARIKALESLGAKDLGAKKKEAYDLMDRSLALREISVAQKTLEGSGADVSTLANVLSPGARAIVDAGDYAKDSSANYTSFETGMKKSLETTDPMEQYFASPGETISRLAEVRSRLDSSEKQMRGVDFEQVMGDLPMHKAFGLSLGSENSAISKGQLYDLAQYSQAYNRITDAVDSVRSARLDDTAQMKLNRVSAGLERIFRSKYSGDALDVIEKIGGELETASVEHLEQDPSKIRRRKGMSQDESYIDRIGRILDKVVTTSSKVTAFAQGGQLPGYGGGDTVPAMLEPGEFIMRKEAVSKYGAGLMSMINGLKIEGRNFQSIVRGVRGFREGGAVTPQPAALSPAGVYNLNLTIGGRQFPLMGEKAVIGALTERLRREGLTTK